MKRREIYIMRGHDRFESEEPKAEAWEGEDIMYYIGKDLEAIKCDELTAGRIRSIYSRIEYGDSTPSDLARYYEIPIKVIRDIAAGKIFESITRDLN